MPYLFVVGEAAIRHQSKTYVYHAAFDMVDDLPEDYRLLVQLLDAAADTNGTAAIPDVGACKYRMERVSDFFTGDMLPEGQHYYIVDPHALRAFKAENPEHIVKLYITDNP